MLKKYYEMANVTSRSPNKWSSEPPVIPVNTSKSRIKDINSLININKELNLIRRIIPSSF